MKTKNTITLASIQALAEQLESDAAAVRDLLAKAQDGEIGTAEAVKQLRRLGIAIF
jgi:hypothetical protein